MSSSPRHIYRKKTQEVYSTLMQKQKLETRASKHQKYTQMRMGKFICALGLQNEDPLVLLGLLSQMRSHIDQLDGERREKVRHEGRSLWNSLKEESLNNKQ